MTGTIATSASKLVAPTTCIALFQPIGLQYANALSLKFAQSYDSKLREIVADIKDVHVTGRPILIGTRSIDKSEDLSKS